MAVKASATITLTSYRDTQSVTRYYKLQPAGSSAPLKPETKPPSSDWTDSEPACDISKELYFCDLTIFSNGEGEYSKVSKSTSYEAAKEAYNRADNAQKSIDNLEIGGRNLFLNTGEVISNNSYLMAEYTPANEPLKEGEIYTATICVTPAENVSGIKLYFSYGLANDPPLFSITGTSKQIISKTFTMEYYDGYTPDVNPIYGHALFYRFPEDGTVTGKTTIHWCKIEKGNKATDWTPAPEDVDNNVKDSVDNLEIGGRNLLLDSSITDVNKWFLNGADYPENVNRTHSADGGKMEVIETSDNPLSAYFFVNFGNNYAQLSTEFRKHIQGGVWLTISGDVKINFDTDGQDHLGFDFRPIDNYAIKRYVQAFFPQNMPKNTWVRIKGSAYIDEITDVTIGRNLLCIELISDASRTVGSVVEYRNIKLEIGNKATDWTPAPEDVDAGIANAQETADSIAINIYVPDSTLLDGSKISDGSLSINQMDDTVAGTYSDPTTKRGTMEWKDDALHIKSIDANAQNTYETVIGGDGIKFNWNGAETASINQDELRINKTVVINAMEVGNWSWAIHPTTGNLMVKWNGGDS